ncbi:MAG TPA: DNA polymerase III subunit alpha [Planctomycetota bacterium]|nr:DNA polymerase III subunit alpha [Planctomycetota bacterium]
MAAPFTHLHVHSHYSLLDGAIDIDGLVGEAVRLGMGALALTDHGNLFGAIEFYAKARKAGINPILGCEAYLVNGDATAPREEGDKSPRHHVTLLARDRRGWENLSRLSSLSWTKGLQRKPRLDKTMLAAHHEGLLALSGCMSGEVAQQVLAGKLDDACRTALQYADLFGRDSFWLEVMSNGLPQQAVIRDGLTEVSRRTGLPLVATNDIHYRCPGDAKAQDALICIATGQRMHDEQRRFRIETDQLHFRSSQEMAQLFGEDSQAYRSTAEIASRCDIRLDLGTMHLPRFEIPGGEPPEAFLRRLCEDGLRRRYGELTAPVRERFETEFAVITKMGFVSYFLIVWDLIRFARENGIPVGPGRGSAAGSIVAYALEITQLDPLRYDLLFERFLNADRISMPDIDIDFCRDRREEVIEYARRRYGSEQVCQIVTFGTLAAKAAIRDAGRVLDVPLPEVDRLAKRIPDGPNKSLKEAVEADKELASMFEGSEQLRELLDVGLRIEGMVRNTSTHAAGVVITDRPLMDLVPLCVVQGQVNTQLPMNDLESIGLLKMDFLGLKNLTILEKVRTIVRDSHGVEVDFDALPLDDAASYALLKRGDVTGVFQLESSGMRELVMRLQPDCFEDIIALIALYRPGPLQSGMVDSFVRRKHGQEPIRHDHPLMEPLLRDTYGTLVYQEQVMRLAQVLAGMSLNDADGLRKAMGKKDKKRMGSYEEKFLKGCAGKGLAAPVAAKIWSDMSRFAEYGFNKSHSAAYGLITFRTAYMKAHWPGEFLCALMSCDADNTDKVAEYVEECRRGQRPVLAPDANSSWADFRLEGEAVRYGLGAIKGVGGRVVEALLAARALAGGRFRSLADLLDRLDARALNRAAFDALVKAGTFDALERNRAALLASSERLLRDAARAQQDRLSGQSQLFGGAAAAALEVRLERAAAPAARDVLEMEKEALGLWISVDPLAEVRSLLHLLCSHDMAALRELDDRAEVCVGGLVTALRTTVSSKGRSAGQPMAMFRVLGPGGGANAVIFPRSYQRYRDLLRDDATVILRATLDRTRDEPALLVNEVLDIADPAVGAGRRLLLEVRGGTPDEVHLRLDALREILPRHPGPTETYLVVEREEGRLATFRLGEQHRVALSVPLLAALEETLGAGRIHAR